MPLTVQHSPFAHRFHMEVGDHRCVLDYELEGKVMTILHTGVPAAVAGQGIAGSLTRAALLWARSEGFKVRPRCSYSLTFFDRHPEFADLRI